MRLFYRLTLLLVGLAIISSCSEDDFDRDPVLKISETSLTFTKDAGEKSVAVNMNDGDKLLFSGVSDWMTITETDQGFNVSVLANDAFFAREVSVKVHIMKGSLTENVTVSQAPGGEAYIKVSEEKMRVAPDVGTFDLFIDSNVDWDIVVEGEFDWLAIDESAKEKDAISLTLTENTEFTKRVAKIKLVGKGTGLGTEAIVTVTQKGAMYYDFPYSEMGYIYEGSEFERGYLYPLSYSKMYAFEAARGSTFRNAAGRLYRFATKSPVYNDIFYMLHHNGISQPSLRAAVIESTVDPLTYLDDPIFLEFLEDEGYEFVWRNDNVTTATYWNKETQVALQIFGLTPLAPDYPKCLTFIHSKIRPNEVDKQTDAYPTYDAVPAYYAEWGASAEQIMAWEATQGSRFLPEDSAGDVVLAFAPDQTKEPAIIERVYYMDKAVMPRVLKTTMLLLRDYEKAVYPTGNMLEGHEYSPSNEYKLLMLEGGFTYKGRVPNSPTWEFENRDEGLLWTAIMRRFPSEGYIPRLCVDIIPLN